MSTERKELIRRTVALRVKLSPDISERLDAIARPRGLTAATIGALAVGEFVERFEQSMGVRALLEPGMAVTEKAKAVTEIEAVS